MIDPRRVRRLLVVRLDNVGDVVLLTPALRALRRSLPGAHLCLLASPAGAALAPLLPWVDEVRVARALWQDASGALPFDPAREQALVAGLRQGAYDAAVISTSFAQSAHPPAYACYLAGIPLRGGFAADFAGGVLSHPITPPPDGTHQADRGLRLVEALGAPPAGPHLELAVPAEATARVRAELGEGYVVLAPGASCPSRRYPAERFAAVAAGLRSATGLPLVVVGAGRERDLAAQVAGTVARSLAGLTDLPELAAVIAGAALVVANNSGPLHLADAFERPTVALYAGTEREAEFAPRRAPLRLLRVPTTCSPCRAFVCPYQLECLDLAPAAVVAAALDLLPVACGS